MTRERTELQNAVADLPVAEGHIKAFYEGCTVTQEDTMETLSILLKVVKALTDEVM